MDGDGKFACVKCGFSSKFNYFGKTPPFAKSLVLMEDAYVMKDPFTDERGKCIIIGSQCTACLCKVCVSQDCSIFYTKRFCVDCVKANLDAFPTEIQQEIAKKQSTEG